MKPRLPFSPFSRLTGSARSVFVLLAVASLTLASQGCSTTRKQTEFASPEVAVQQFTAAIRAGDNSALREMLGSQSDEVLNSGDEVADRQGKQRFLEAYDAKHSIARGETEESMVLVVGKEDWPLPIPMVRDSETGRWRWDTAAGREELINRRIGRNELDVIQVCKAFVDAQVEYAARDPDRNGIPEYAQKVISDPGQRNGLYWETKPDEEPSPLGPLVAAAVDEGYSAAPKQSPSEPRPYHGYLFHLLRSQGPNAPGGARDYMVNGYMIGGFAAVAHPAEYGVSGIMTFIVSHDGVVYQQDLGDDTAAKAKAMTTFDPGIGWTKVDPAPAK